MSVRKSGKKKKRPPTPAWRCPKCGATVTVSERDNDSRCGACGFKPYDWHLPNMPPLIDDVVMSEEGWRRFNAEAEEVRKVAKEIGWPRVISISRPAPPAKESGLPREGQ